MLKKNKKLIIILGITAYLIGVINGYIFINVVENSVIELLDL
jgi:hypothetical protein